MPAMFPPLRAAAPAETDDEKEVHSALLTAFGGLSVSGLLWLNSLPETRCAKMLASLLAQHAFERELLRARGQRTAPLRDAQSPSSPKKKTADATMMNESLAWSDLEDRRALEAQAQAQEIAELRRRLAECEAQLATPGWTKPDT